MDKAFDLFAELNASDEQMDFKVVYASGMNGVAGLDHENIGDDLTPVFDIITELPEPKVDDSKPLQLLIANIDYDDFKGKMGIGRVLNGKINVGESIAYGKPGEDYKQGKIAEMFMFDNIGRQSVQGATAGDIVMITGIEDITIGDTIMDKEDPQPMEAIAVEEPTVRMSIGVNKSPLAGKEGRHIYNKTFSSNFFYILV